MGGSRAHTANRRPRAPTLVVAAIVCACVVMPGARFAGAGGALRTVTDPQGDVGPLPDCEVPASPSEPGDAVDVVAVEVADTDTARTVTIRADGDLSAAVSAGPDARVEVWAAGDDDAPVYRFRRGVQAGNRVDDVVDAQDQQLDVTPVPVDAGPRGEAIFQFPSTLLDQLGLLGDLARFGVVVVVGPRCDKLGIGRVRLELRPMEPFAAESPATSTTKPASEPAPDRPGTEAHDGGGLPSWAIALMAAAAVGIFAAILRLFRGGGGGWADRAMWIADRAACEALQERCDELRRKAAEAEQASDESVAAAQAADDHVREARRPFIDARDAAQAAADADAAAAGEGTDDSDWVEGERGRVTRGDLELREQAAAEAQGRYEREEISAEELEAEWRALGEEGALEERRRQRDARAAEAARQAEETRAAEGTAAEALAAAEAAADAAWQRVGEARDARDRAGRAAEEACREAAECFEGLEEGGIIPPPPPVPDDADFGT